MMVRKAFEYRIYPNKKQEQFLTNQFGSCRFVYNYFLRERISYYATHKDDKRKSLTYHDTALMLTKLKHTDEFSWLNGSSAQALQASLRNLDVAYNNFFNHKAAFPAFKSRRDKQSFTNPQRFRLEVKNNVLVAPKVGAIRAVIDRPPVGTIKKITIKKAKSGRYFASILCEVEINPRLNTTGKSIGIDLGLKSFLVTSDCEIVSPGKFYRKSEDKLKLLGRRLSRKAKGSKNRNKARVNLAKLHEKVANQRKDFLHKLSRRLVDENQVIYAEDLNVKGMISNHKLAKSIQDAGWGMFINMLGYKCEWYGSNLVKIDRFFPSSKMHSGCGYINQGLTLKDREWACPGCGELVDRDLNAAENILVFGTAGTAGNHARGNRSSKCLSVNRENAHSISP